VIEVYLNEIRHDRCSGINEMYNRRKTKNIRVICLSTRWKCRLTAAVFFLIIGLTYYNGTGIGVSASEKNGKLIVAIDGFRSDEGRALIALFSSKEGFPDKSKKAFGKNAGTIRERKAVVEFIDIPHGTYAVGVLHDENGNGKMDTNWLGVPKEGYGSSNNVKTIFSPPSFEKAAFTMNDDSLVVTIQMNY